MSNRILPLFLLLAFGAAAPTASAAPAAPRTISADHPGHPHRARHHAPRRVKKTKEVEHPKKKDKA